MATANPTERSVSGTGLLQQAIHRHPLSTLNMKKICVAFLILVAATLACDLSRSSDPFIATSTPAAVVVPATDVTEPTALAATDTPAEPPTATAPAFEGAPVLFGPVSLVLPPGLAGGISGLEIPRDDGPDVPPWGLTPGHTVVRLEGYLLQGRFHQPQIFVYPATGYAELLPGAFESMHRLRNILADPGTVNGVEQLPGIPFFNAAPVFASNLEVISFQNGQGVRFLTEYAQYFASVNNHDLFYHFQGFTGDGEYYIIAILPITANVLAETNEPGAVLPTGGIPFPDINDPEVDFQSYYNAVTELLNTTATDSFTPVLAKLDLLIQSLRIHSP